MRRVAEHEKHTGKQRRSANPDSRYAHAVPHRSRLDIKPLTPRRFHDLETLFSGPGGSQVRGCWCMFYRRSGRSEVPEGMSGSAHAKCSLKSIVDAGTAPGLIGYRDGEPVAWVSLGPRGDFARLRRSPVMKPVDEKPVWSVVCFYTAKRLRGNGIAAAMLAGAIDFARRRGARWLEAYPIDRGQRSADESLWFGCKSMYDRAGFAEVARRRPARPVMRKVLRATRA
jgi:GNAT superfamily N-acetyltransferase